ncbi:uncharacterized protein LOC121854688 isoform X2 [Homarus americanus]|nr:uncharacterized protein LOC121854688 isoform X2 [Homarus americanus]
MWKDIRNCVLRAGNIKENYSQYFARYMFQAQHKDHKTILHHFLLQVASLYPPPADNIGNPSAPFDNKNVNPTRHLEYSDNTATSVNPQCKRSLNGENGAVSGNQSIPGDEEAIPIQKRLRSHRIVKPHNVSSEASVSNVSVEHDRDADVTVEKRMFHCDICEGIYSSAQQLKTHMKFFHSYEKPHQLVFPVHKQLEGNAKEINDTSCLVRNEAIYLKEECIDPVHVKEEFPEPVFVKEEFPEPVCETEECTEPVCVKEEFLEPRYVNEELIETIYVKEECIDPTYGGGVY